MFLIIFISEVYRILGRKETIPENYLQMKKTLFNKIPNDIDIDLSPISQSNCECESKTITTTAEISKWFSFSYTNFIKIL